MAGVDHGEDLVGRQVRPALEQNQRNFHALMRRRDAVLAQHACDFFPALQDGFHKPQLRPTFGPCLIAALSNGV